MVTLRQLRRRTIVQWAAAYAAHAWVVLQVLSLSGGQVGGPPALLRRARAPPGP